MDFLHTLSKRIRHWYFRASRTFEDSESYWKQRYALGGNSGAGSYNEMATFKADVLNTFVRKRSVQSVIEFGCGDGNQLRLARYPAYHGLDVSPLAVETCRSIFTGDPTKRFGLVKDYAGETADLALSLDVIFHLVEDEVFHAYMERLFDAGERFVIAYSSDTDDNTKTTHPHVRHRRFTDWVREHRPGWRMTRHIPNAHPYNGDNESTSFADFFVFERV